MAVTWKKLAYEDECVLVADTDASGYGFFIDEDNMISDDATKFPTQQSVKKYVDDNIVARGVTLSEALTWGTL